MLPVADGGVHFETAALGRELLIMDRLPLAHRDVTLPSDCWSRLGIDGGRFAPHVGDAARASPVWTYEDQISGRVPATHWFHMRLATRDRNETLWLDTTLAPRARLPPSSLRRFCLYRSKMREGHTPEESCPDEAPRYAPTAEFWRPQPHHEGPWCVPPSSGDGLHIFSAECVGVDNYVSHQDVAFTLFTLGSDGRSGIISTDRNRVGVDTSIGVSQFDELGVISTIEYTYLPGEMGEHQPHHQ